MKTFAKLNATSVVIRDQGEPRPLIRHLGISSEIFWDNYSFIHSQYRFQMDLSTVTSVSAIALVVPKTRIMEKYVGAQVGLTRGVYFHTVFFPFFTILG